MQTRLATARPHLLAGAMYLALALVLVFPVLGAPTRLALGHPGNDVWNHVWGYAWIADELARGELPIHTDALGWPRGGSLWFIDIFNAVLTLPVQWVAGPVAAYNASYLLNFWLCGFGAWLLARGVLRDEGAPRSWAGGVPLRNATSGPAWPPDPAALLAGVAYMTTPHFLAQAYNGISETLAAGWLPLAVLAMRGAVRAPSARRGALAGALWALCTLAN